MPPAIRLTASGDATISSSTSTTPSSSSSLSISGSGAVAAAAAAATAPRGGGRRRSSRTRQYLYDPVTTATASFGQRARRLRAQQTQQQQYQRYQQYQRLNIGWMRYLNGPRIVFVGTILIAAIAWKSELMGFHNDDVNSYSTVLLGTSKAAVAASQNAKMPDSTVTNSNHNNINSNNNINNNNIRNNSQSTGTAGGTHFQSRATAQVEVGGGGGDDGDDAVACPTVSIQDHTMQLTERPCRPITVAYAISLIKCGDGQSTPEGLVDAAMVLHHSIHRISSRVRNQAGEPMSNYDYKMYALVHHDAQRCSHVLNEAGFEVLVKSPPLETKDIRGEYLRKNIRREVCCGHDEFIKLYAYTLPEPLVVHVDMDFIFHKPMDQVFDSMLYHKDSMIGQLARQHVERERHTDPWPDAPQAVMTRDWPQVFPGRNAGYQAGFIVLRPNPTVLTELVDIIKEGDFVPGNQPANGWGGKGYGGFVGAKAMQGLIAYYYDIFAPDTWVELNQCRYNHMGIDTKFNPGGFGYRPAEKGTCRNRMTTCEDCMHTDRDFIYSIHYTKCRKPWNCIGEGDSSITEDMSNTKSSKAAIKKLIPEQLIHLDHCLELLQVWHNVRSDLENQLVQLVSHDSTTTIKKDDQENNTNQTAMVNEARRGTYKTDYFQGHCLANGKYLTLAGGHKETLQRIPELYRHSNDDNDKSVESLQQ